MAVDDLVNDIFSRYRRELINVTTCANTVRVERKDTTNGYITRDAKEDSLWKVYRNGRYVCGMETPHDAFRVIRLLDEQEAG